MIHFWIIAPKRLSNKYIVDIRKKSGHSQNYYSVTTGTPCISMRGRILANGKDALVPVSAPSKDSCCSCATFAFRPAHVKPPLDR